MTLCEKLLHVLIIIMSALLGAFKPNQSMMVFPRCDGIDGKTCLLSLGTASCGIGGSGGNG